MAAPVEIKVKVATAAATITAAVLAGVADVLPSGAVPGWLAAPVLAIVTGGVTFAFSWLARHTPRNIADVEVDTTPPVIPPPAGPTTQS